MFDDAFKVYNAVAKSNQPISTISIAKQTGLSQRTVQRINQIWVKQGFFGLVRCEKSNAYLFYSRVEIKKP